MEFSLSSRTVSRRPTATPKKPPHPAPPFQKNKNYISPKINNMKKFTSKMLGTPVLA